MTESNNIHRSEQVPARDAPLCENCQYIFDRWYRRPQRRILDTWNISTRKSQCTPNQLLYNARTCPSCHLLLSKNHKSVVSFLEDDSGLIGSYEVALLGDTHAVALRFKTSTDSNVLCLSYPVGGAPSRAGLVDESTTVEDLTTVDNFVPRIPDEIDDPLTWKRITQWLDKCVKSSSHTLCRERILDREIPARLIRIPQEFRDLQLVSTEDINDMAMLKYATLTHCWGTEKVPFMTTRANLSELQTKIPFNALGKTFQDAVTSCCRLGLEYLWIDSLCIIQDDNDDWTDQAYRMGSIYSECVLNIVAGSSERDSDGFLTTRKDRLIQEFATMATIDRKGGKCEEIYACLQLGIPLAKMAISKRGWCFQETILAPRSVYFHDNGVYWQCRTQCVHEIFPTGIHTGSSLRRLSVQAATRDENVTTHDILRHGYQGIHGDRAIKHVNWFKLVEEYSGRQLTYGKDKLVALAGIARLMSVNYRLLPGSSDGVQDYLAGLWRIDLHRQLLWKANSAKARPEDVQAPSWSWASTDANISFPIGDWHDYRTNFEILTATTTPSSNDGYGAVDGGVLQLRCNSLVPVKIQVVTDKSNVWDKYKLCHEESILIDSRLYFDAEPLEGIELMALTGWKEPNRTHGILLVETSVAGTFRRVGAFDIWSSEPGTIRVEERGQDKSDQYLPIASLLPFDAPGERIVISVV